MLANQKDRSSENSMEQWNENFGFCKQLERADTSPESLASPSTMCMSTKIEATFLINQIWQEIQRLITSQETHNASQSFQRELDLQNQDCNYFLNKSNSTYVRSHNNNQEVSMWNNSENAELLQLSKHYIGKYSSSPQKFSQDSFFEQFLTILEKEHFGKKEYIYEVKKILASILTASIVNREPDTVQRILKACLEQENNITKEFLESQMVFYLTQNSFCKCMCPNISYLLQKYEINVCRQNEGKCKKQYRFLDDSVNDEEYREQNENCKSECLSLTRPRSSLQAEQSKSDISIITSIQTEHESFKGFEDEISEIDFKIPSNYHFPHSNESEQNSDSEESVEEQQKICEYFSKDIWDYSLKCTETYHKAWQDISPVFYELCKIGKQLDMLVEVVGSFATSLWTPHSDINIFFVPEKEQSFNIKTYLSRIYNKLKSQKAKLNYHCLFLNDKMKDQPFMNIKIEIGEEEKRRISLSIVTKRHIARTYAKYVSDCVKANPFIAPIYFTFHKLLQNFDLHKPNKRGLKTYAIFLMIMKSFQAFPSYDLAQAFSNFIYFFSQIYQFQEEVVIENGVAVEREKLCLVDPINPSIKFGGKNTNISRLTQLFGAVSSALKMGLSKNILEYLWSLHLMFQDEQEEENFGTAY